MKILTAIDLLREKTIRLEIKEDHLDDFSPQQKIVLSHQKGEKVLGEIVTIPREVPSGVANINYKILRIATKQEIEKYEELQKGRKERLKKAKDLSQKLKLEMHFFESRVNFDNRIISFFFTSNNPVDFREFLKKIIPEFPGKRIHLERVGMREKARMVGGIGTCGRGEDCCQFWNHNTQTLVPLDAVRDQGIVINKNEKIFGVHGKIKSCFLHEWDLYKEKRRFLPHMKQKVSVGQKKGRVMGLDILNQRVKISFEDDSFDIHPIAEVNFENKKNAPAEPEVEIPELSLDIETTEI